MNKLLILTSYTRFELNSLRNNEIAVKLLIRDIFGCRDTVKVRNDIITACTEKRERKTTVFGEKTGTHFARIREPKYHKLQAKYRNVENIKIYILNTIIKSKYQNLHTKYRYRKNTENLQAQRDFAC